MPSPVLLFVLVSFIIYSFRVLIFSPFHFSTFSSLKVHIKYEKRKNVAITLSIKDLKGLLEVA